MRTKKQKSTESTSELDLGEERRGREGERQREKNREYANKNFF